MKTYDLTNDLSEPRLVCGEPNDGKTLKWLQLATDASGTRPGLCGLHRDNGVTAATDGYRLHVAPTPRALENETAEVIRPLDGKWPTPAAKAQSYVATVQEVKDIHYPAYREIVKSALDKPVAAAVRLDGKYLREFCDGLQEGEAVEITITHNTQPVILATVPTSNNGKCPARWALVMPISASRSERQPTARDAAYDPFAELRPAPTPPTEAASK